MPFLFFANKCDLAGSLSAIKCAQMLDLDKGDWMRGGSSVIPRKGLLPMGGRPWHMCASSAVTGDGLDEGFNWLIGVLENKLL